MNKHSIYDMLPANNTL